MGKGRPTFSPATRRANADAWWVAGLALAVFWVYLPPSLFAGRVLFGHDSFVLHVRRLEFAREHLFGSWATLPAWYPRELMGTPFWSNLQNFPLIPTRFPLLLIDPWSAHGVGVNIAAVLAAMFTYLLGRRLGLGRLGAVVAGWTFACGGFFASRVTAGHLPLLEAYPALPLLLWLVERYATAASVRALRQNLLALGLSAGAVMLAGHPQLPVYAVGAALLYLPIRTTGRKVAIGAAAVVAGVACMSFVLYPMLRFIGRSTRTLALAPAPNDVHFPLRRLAGFVLPWGDVRPETYEYWDTACYVGLFPLAAAAALGVRWAVTRRSPGRAWVFLSVLGVAALVLAFPRPWTDGAGGFTLLRSPARQVYFTVFGLAFAAGAGLDALLRLRPRMNGRGAVVATVIVGMLVVGHALDVKTNVAEFVSAVERPPDADVPAGLGQAVGDGRVAMDTEEIDATNRRLDDVGVFDSILLARPYRALQALAGRPPSENVQLISAPDLGPRALAWAGARMVVTTRTDLALPTVEKGTTMTVYSVPGALPRAGFVPELGVTFADDDEVLRTFRAGAAPSVSRMFLPASVNQAELSANGEGPASGAAGPVADRSANETAAPLQVRAVEYRRPASDRIEVSVRAPTAGYIRILEAFDPGWSATVDGRAAEILPADTFVQAVRVAPGPHEIRLTYRTPGTAIGVALSVAGALALALMVWGAPRFIPAAPAPP